MTDLKDRRILIGVTASMSLGFVRELATTLALEGWEVFVACTPSPALDQLGNYPGVTAVPIQMARAPSPLADLRALGAWIRAVRRVRPTVTYLGTPKAGLLGALAGRLLRVPTRIYVVYGLRVETARGPLRAILSLSELMATRSSTTILAVSESVGRELVRRRLSAADKVTVLGPGSAIGVDMDRFDRTRFSAREINERSIQLGIAPGLPVVGFVGRLTRDKGVFELAEASRILAEQGVAHQLLLIGGVDDASGALGLAEINRLGSAPVFVGEVPDASPYYPLMDVLCLPTYREGFPTVVLEAAAAGVPTVTTAVTGAIDSVKDGVTGVIVPPRDAKGLALGLMRVLGSSAARDQMGANAYRWVNDELRTQVVQARIRAYIYLQADRAT